MAASASCPIIIVHSDVIGLCAKWDAALKDKGQVPGDWQLAVKAVLTAIQRFADKHPSMFIFLRSPAVTRLAQGSEGEHPAFCMDPDSRSPWATHLGLEEITPALTLGTSLDGNPLFSGYHPSWGASVPPLK